MLSEVEACAAGFGACLGHPRFSLRMKEMPRKAGPGETCPATRVSCGPQAPSHPESHLARRLAALRHALANADAEAARMAAYMMARGYCRKALPPLRPWAGFGPERLWGVLCAPASVWPTPDTS